MFPGFAADGAGCLTLITWPVMALVWVLKAPVSLGRALRSTDGRGLGIAVLACGCLLLLNLTFVAGALNGSASDFTGSLVVLVLLFGAEIGAFVWALTGTSGSGGSRRRRLGPRRRSRLG